MKFIMSAASVSTKLSLAAMAGVGLVATVPEQAAQPTPETRLVAQARPADVPPLTTPAIEVRPERVVPIIPVASRSERERQRGKTPVRKRQKDDEDAAERKAGGKSKDAERGKTSRSGDDSKSGDNKKESAKSDSAHGADKKSGDKNGRGADAKVKAPDAAGIPVAPTPGEMPPPPDVWSETEIIAALQECLRDLAPIAAEIEIDQPLRKGQCGAAAPVDLRRVGPAPGPRTVVFKPAVTINCKMVVALHTWINTVLQPKAVAMYGSPVTRIIGSSGYSCRNRYGLPNTRLSEHAKANAIDIGGFVLADGRKIQVLGSWGPTKRDLVAKAKAEAKAAREARQAKEEKQKDARAKADKAKAKSGEGDDREDTEAVPIPVRASDRGKKTDVALRTTEASMLGADLPEECAEQPEKARSRKKRLTKSQRRAQAAAAKRCAEAEEKRKEEIAAVMAPAPDAKELSQNAKFLRELHKGACGVFGTVLGPEANEAHRNHFHFDLTPRKRKAFCE